MSISYYKDSYIFLYFNVSASYLPCKLLLFQKFASLFFYFLVTVLSFNASLEERPLAKLQICYQPFLLNSWALVTQNINLKFINSFLFNYVLAGQHSSAFVFLCLLEVVEFLFVNFFFFFFCGFTGILHSNFCVSDNRL